MGRKPTKFPGKVDCHPPKGYENWWERESEKENKKGARQRAKKEIAKQISLKDTEDD